MPLFYLHLDECGKMTFDEEGRDLPSLAAAREAAILSAREMMCAEIKQGRLCMSCSIVIEDSSHEQIDVVTFWEAVIVTGAGSIHK